jgi:peptide/nickel transport system substrate-binding protein
MQPASTLDPHFATTQSDIMLNHQVYDYLVYVDETNAVVPHLATEWESADGIVWVFTLRDGVVFHDGSPVTAEDIVYSFDRLRDPGVGTPTVSLYENVESVEALDPLRVQFTLTVPNPEFPADAGDYHAAILSKDSDEAAGKWIGSGPFVVESYDPEDRAVLAKKTAYWLTGTDGESLPYLDGITFIFSPDQNGQIAALQGDELQFVPGLSAELAAQVQADDSLRLIKNPSNMHFVIHMRSDEGRPTADVRVRQALMLATDHQAIADTVRPGLALVGNGTPVGPAYKAYYLERPPQQDTAKAKQLLADAGYADGLEITLYAQTSADVPGIATVWKEQMKQIGVEVDIQSIPPDVYYGEGDSSWLEVDFGITDWGTRAVPLNYFKLAYVGGALYNESHWSDTEFDELTAQIESELDDAARAELYKKAQEILIERGPVIVPYVVEAVAGVSAAVDGITLTSDWPRTLLRGAHFTE